MRIQPENAEFLDKSAIFCSPAWFDNNDEYRETTYTIIIITTFIVGNTIRVIKNYAHWAHTHTHTNHKQKVRNICQYTHNSSEANVMYRNFWSKIKIDANEIEKLKCAQKASIWSTQQRYAWICSIAFNSLGITLYKLSLLLFVSLHTYGMCKIN